METLLPSNAAEAGQAIAWAVAEKKKLALTGHGTKAKFGRPIQADFKLDLSRLSGIVEYEPAELVLTVKPGTRVDEIEKLLASSRQMLAFEPPDWGPLWGGPSARGSIGGLIAVNGSGPRRFKAGALRDHLLGLSGITGRGEAIRAGAKVVKNVTGYDLPKLITGAFGTLMALTEVTLKVLPMPEKTRTLLLFGLSDEAAIRAMSLAAQSPQDVSGLAHLPKEAAAKSGVGYIAKAGKAVTAFRLEGTDISVNARLRALRDLLKDQGEQEELHSMNSAWLWRELRDGALLALPLERPLWRVSLAPTDGAAFVAALRGQIPEAEVVYDWAGGLVWLGLPARTSDGGAALLRGALAAFGGHATLLRAEESVRAATPVFQPQAEALQALSLRVKESFDPLHIFNRGRMWAEI